MNINQVIKCCKITWDCVTKIWLQLPLTSEERDHLMFNLYIKLGHPLFMWRLFQAIQKKCRTARKECFFFIRITSRFFRYFWLSFQMPFLFLHSCFIIYVHLSPLIKDDSFTSPNIGRKKFFFEWHSRDTTYRYFTHQGTSWGDMRGYH